VKVLIPGGSGSLGKALVPELLAHGHQVVVLSRHPQEVHFPPEVQVAAWDSRSAAGWEQLVEEVDAVINLAGENIGAGRWTPERKDRIRNSRIQAGTAIVAALRGASKKPALLIQASGIGAYGPRGEEVIDESAAFGNDFIAGVARDWEASTQAVETMGVRRVIIRTGLVMMPSEGFLVPLMLPFRLFAGGPLGNGKQWWPWIHIQDYVQAVLFLLQKPGATGVFNLVNPNPCRMADFGKELGRVLHRPYWFPTPAFMLNLLLGEMSTLVLDGQRAIPQRLLDYGYSYRYSQLHPALVDLFG
jgi:uncharacterized protein